MSNTFTKGDRVKVVNSPWPAQLPNGAEGVVTEEVFGTHLFVDTPDYSGAVGAFGWPLTSDEVEAA